MFKEYKFGIFKKEIRELIRKRLKVKNRIRYHKIKIEHHQEKFKILKEKTMIEVEKELDLFLKKAERKI